MYRIMYLGAWVSTVRGLQYAEEFVKFQCDKWGCSRENFYFVPV